MAITKKTSAKKYKQAQNMTIYFNSVKRSGKEKREDAFLMIDDEKLIGLATTLRDEHDLPKKEIAIVIMGLILEEGNVNCTLGDEEKHDASNSDFDIASILEKFAK